MTTAQFPIMNSAKFAPWTAIIDLEKAEAIFVETDSNYLQTPSDVMKYVNQAND